MSYLENFENIQELCRVCLSKSSKTISFETEIEKAGNTLKILEALERLLYKKINSDEKYPRVVCSFCCGLVKSAHDIKEIYEKTQRILDKYIQVERLIKDVPYHDASKQFSQAEGDNFCNTSEIIERATEKDIEVKFKNISRIKPKVSKTANSIKCPHCYAVFINKQELSAHFDVCKKIVIQKCDYCDTIFNSISRKNIHMRLKHSKNKEYKCDICDKVFSTTNAKAYHKSTRHSSEETIYKCEVCGKIFYVKNSLKQHMEVHEKGVSRVICPICGKSFHYRGGLFYHMKVHLNQRNYTCTFCPKKFLNMASLKRHTQTHTGDRPYFCSYCTKKFCSIGEVKIHEKRHLGHKPYGCSYCRKSFISPYNMRLHMSSHPGNQPCQVCHKKFLNDDVLKLHFRFKHTQMTVTDEQQVANDAIKHVFLESDN